MPRKPASVNLNLKNIPKKTWELFKAYAERHGRSASGQLHYMLRQRAELQQLHNEENPR